MKKITGSLVAALLCVGLASGVQFRPALTEEATFLGATHILDIQHSDLTETNLNTAQTLTFNVSAKQTVELIMMSLAESFNAGDNATGSVAVVVGDSAGADFYLDSTELNSNQSGIVWRKFGRSAQSAVGTTTSIVYAATNDPSITLNVTTVTNEINGTNYVMVTDVAVDTATLTSKTQTVVSAVSNVDSSAGRKVYTSKDMVKVKFTPNSENSLSENSTGKVRFYFRIK